MTTQSNNMNDLTFSDTSVFKMVALFLLMIFSCCLGAMLFSYSPEDLAWVNSGVKSTGEFHNIFGSLGAWVSDVLLTGVGYAAYLLPMGGIYLAFRLWREIPLNFELLIFRVVALLCAILAMSVIATAHMSTPINSVAISGGGMMGQFFVMSLSKLISIGLLMFLSIVLFALCLLLFFNVSPLAIVDGIGNLILGKKIDALERQSAPKPKLAKSPFKLFAQKSENRETNEALQAKLRAVNELDQAQEKVSGKLSDEEADTVDEVEPKVVRKSSPTITPPHYEKARSQEMSDERLGMETVEVARETLTEPRRTPKQTIGDLTSLLRPNKKSKPEPKLTETDEQGLSLDMHQINSKEQEPSLFEVTKETVPEKQEPSLLSKALGRVRGEVTQPGMSSAQEQVRVREQSTAEIDRINAINEEIEAFRQANQHQDNSVQAQNYREQSAYARNENPAERFVEPAPMRTERQDIRDYDRPIAPSRKPVNPEIQKQIVSDILADTERQSQLRQAPLQAKKAHMTEPFEHEIAKSVSEVSRVSREPQLVEPQLVKPQQKIKPQQVESAVRTLPKSEHRFEMVDTPSPRAENAPSDFVSQLNAQVQDNVSHKPVSENKITESQQEFRQYSDERFAERKSVMKEPVREQVQLEATPSVPSVDNTSVPSVDNSSNMTTERFTESTQVVSEPVRELTQRETTPSVTSTERINTTPVRSTSPSSMRVNIGQAYETTQKSAQVPIVPTHHELPSIELLDNPRPLNAAYTEDDLRDMAETLETTCKQFKLDVTVMNISPGPVITRFEMDLAPGVQAKKISALSNDLARALAVSSVRVEEVITGSSYIGLEVPNMNRQTVYLKDIFKSKEFQGSKSPLTVALGTDISGQPVVADLKKMPHLLVAGTTGSGKSVSVNTMLLSMLYKATPRDLRMIMVDPKMLEMSMYEDIPHLLTPVITDMQDAENALTWAVAEMERRYKLMAAMKIRKIESFNEIIDEAEARGDVVKDPLWEPNEAVGYTHHPSLERLPYIVIVIDELADMMMVVGKDVEKLIARLTQKARAAGIHLIIATQRPSTDVLTGLIKANVPTRIAFQVSSGTDSKVIIDTPGAQNLLGNGDMLYVPAGSSHPTRLHGAFVNDGETDRITDYLRSTGEPDYINSITDAQDPEDLGAFGAADVEKAAADSDDPLYGEAVEIVLTTGKASISSVQRQLRIGYNRAARMIEQMQADGIVSEPQNGVRKVLKAH